MATGKYKSTKELSSQQISKAEEERLKFKLKWAKKYNYELEKLTKEQSEDFEKAWKKQTNSVGAHMKEMWKSQKKEIETLNKALAVNITNITKGVMGAAGKQLDTYMGAYSDLFSNIETRMLGAGRGFNSVMSTITRGIGGSQATSTLAVLQNLNRLVSSGIMYNVEQRAFLETISDKIAATFDATNGTLTRLIRIYQSDTTPAYLGMENALTRFLNEQFSDSSYLTSNLSKAVSESLLEATSILGKEMGTELEYVVQTWLGSFASVGMSTSALQQIATGLGQLGSGNIEALLGNTSLSNLFISGAKNVGLNYSELLTGGLSAGSANKLLQGIYSQLETIAKTDDLVSRSKYANLFGMTLSDITSVMNLTSNDLKNISSNMLTYAQMVQNTELELSKVLSRTTVKERVENAVSNVMSAMGETITSSAVLYTTYYLTDIMNKAGGLWTPSIPLPFTTIAPMNITQMMNNAVVGFSAISRIPTILSALFGGGTLSLNNWGSTETVSRGTGLNFGELTNRLQRSSSNISYIGSSDSSTFLKDSLADASEKANVVTTSSDYEDNKLLLAIAGSGEGNSTNELLSSILEQVRDLNSQVTTHSNLIGDMRNAIERFSIIGGI